MTVVRMEDSTVDRGGFEAVEGQGKGMIFDFENIAGQTLTPGRTHTGKKSLTKISHILLRSVIKTANGGKMDKVWAWRGIGCEIHKQLS